jgi:hypothetical protein
MLGQSIVSRFFLWRENVNVFILKGIFHNLFNIFFWIVSDLSQFCLMKIIYTLKILETKPHILLFILKYYCSHVFLDKLKSYSIHDKRICLEINQHFLNIF